LPRGAVPSTSNKQQQVMLISKGRMTLRDVKTGLLDSKNIEIIEGLKAGDQIIKDASLSLKENARVKVKKV
jgi:multidrug efflux pump subunit AcrA (membrane-fusion protein)